MSKTAMLGGSFDPIHLGHLFLLHCAASLTPYDSFIIVPAKQSNFKRDNSPSVSDEHRLKMISLALQDFRDLYPEDEKVQLSVSDTEIMRGGISYTYDTVISLKKELLIKDRLGLVMGDDHIGRLNEWYRYPDLKDEVEFLICRRNGGGPLWNMMPEDAVYRKIEVENTAPESATDIRKDLNRYENYLSRRVLEYVREHNLYS